MTRRIRLATGLVLFAYVTTHLLNHALGLIDLEAMEAGRRWFLGLWRNPLGTVLLVGSLATHFALALWALYRRRQLKMPAGEAAQLVLGVSIPLLLLGHMIGTRGSHELAGTEDTYTWVLLIHWKFDTSNLALQTAGLLAAWVHGCIGIYYWLRLKPAFPGLAVPLFSIALLIPILSLLGYAQAGKEVLRLAADPEWLSSATAAAGPPDRGTTAMLEAATVWARYFVVGSVIAVLVARLVRAVVEDRRGTVRLTYPGGIVASFAPGPTILDVSRENGIPHASVCGGRGRCSTCRVRIAEGIESLAAPAAEEQRVLDRIGQPIAVRLACQTRPTGDLSVVPLLPPNATARDGFAGSPQLSGQEKEIAILFADLRSFTAFSEERLPYDVVFILNRYFAGMGEAVEAAGGHLDKFIGDGVMALFGIDTEPEEACRRALLAVGTMSKNLAELNRTLAHELPEPLRMGIGVHVGHAIIGEMGYGSARHLTAVGDAVNTASRLEAMTKEFAAEAVISGEVARHAGKDLDSYELREIDLRGRSRKIQVRVLKDAACLLDA